MCASRMIFLTMGNQREILLEDGTRVPYLLLAPIAAMMRSYSARWKLDVLFALNEGHNRFGEIMRATPGITQHMLTVRLRELERDGFILRRDYGVRPPRVEYALTPAAVELKPIFVALINWARRHAPMMLNDAKESSGSTSTDD
jgi:DNA-binding HxlR family transcriptional regulator